MFQKAKSPSAKAFGTQYVEVLKSQLFAHKHSISMKFNIFTIGSHVVPISPCHQMHYNLDLSDYVTFEKAISPGAKASWTQYVNLNQYIPYL